MDNLKFFFFEKLYKLSPRKAARLISIINLSQNIVKTDKNNLKTFIGLSLLQNSSNSSWMLTVSSFSPSFFDFLVTNIGV